MLVLNNIHFHFGARDMYRDTSWHIKPNEKIGLIGANGTGKSTLLRIINGEFELAGGEITRRRGLTIGFLNQDLLSYDSNRPIVEVAMEAFAEHNKLAADISQMLVALETDHGEQLLHRLHDAQERFEAIGGYQVRSQAESVLEGLGFSTGDLQRPLNEFSGGWRMRVMLAKILLGKPDLLLLDEPTNHLDLPSIEWLENYLDEYEGTVVIVSHDRFFLDRVVNKIVEIEHEKLVQYSGNYSWFLEAKAEAEELRRSQFRNQEKYIKEQERFIDRFRAKASKAKAVQSRIKMLERLERVAEVDDPAAAIKIKFNFAAQPGKTISLLDVHSKKYNDLELFHDTRVQVNRGDKIALIGANGKGKSTLLRMINGSEPFDGKAEDGYNVVKAFYAQHQLESLNLDRTLLEELQYWAPDQSDTTLRTLLGAFLFTGDDVFKKIKVLSGGEKSRVALAKTILTKANFMLLDEPTNHLDIQSVNILIRVLRDFKGSYVIISHDRYFLAEVSNKIWYIEDKKLKEYPGTYDEFEEWKERSAQQLAPPPAQQAVAREKKNEAAKENGADKELKKKQQQLGKTVRQLETTLAGLQASREETLTELSEPGIQRDREKLMELQSKLETADLEISRVKSEWEKAFAELIELE